MHGVRGNSMPLALHCVLIHHFKVLFYYFKVYNICHFADIMTFSVVVEDNEYI